MNCITELPLSDDGAYVSTCVGIDRLTEVHFFLLLIAAQLALLFMRRLWCPHGFSKSFLSDRDTVLVSPVRTSFGDRLGTR